MISDGPIWRNVVWNNRIYEITAWDWNESDPRLGLKDLKTGEQKEGWPARLSEVRDVKPEDYRNLM